MYNEKPTKLSKIQEEQAKLPNTSADPNRVATFLRNEELAKQAMNNK